jgi:hypothetical protein
MSNADLAAEVDFLSRDIAEDEASRQQLIGIVMGAMTKMESPMEILWRIMLRHPPAALMAFIRAGVLADLVAAYII